MPEQVFKQPVGLGKIRENAMKMISVHTTESNSVALIHKELRNLSAAASVEKTAEVIANIQELKRTIHNPETRTLVQEFVVNPLLRSIGRVPAQSSANKDVAQTAVRNLAGQQRDENRSIQNLRDFGPKGQEGRGINTRTRVYAALDNLINKLAALQQPLGMRPDYDSGQGTTGDMAERLGQIKKSLSENEATMIKQIPPMPEQLQTCSPESPAIEDYDEGLQPQAEGPKIIVIENYNDEPEVPCCPGCGQAMPEQMTREAHCLDRRFKAIRDALRKSDLKESQLKVIHSNLNSIYDKYRALEKGAEKD